MRLARKLSWHGTIKSRFRKSPAEADSLRRMIAGFTLDLGRTCILKGAVIHWPSGKVQTIDSLVPDKLYTIEEPK